MMNVTEVDRPVRVLGNGRRFMADTRETNQKINGDVCVCVCKRVRIKHSAAPLPIYSDLESITHIWWVWVQKQLFVQLAKKKGKKKPRESKAFARIFYGP